MMNQTRVTKLTRHISNKTHHHHHHRIMKRSRSDNIIHVITATPGHSPSINTRFAQQQRLPRFLHSTPIIPDIQINHRGQLRKQLFTSCSILPLTTIASPIPVTKIPRRSRSALELPTNIWKIAANKTYISDDEDHILENPSNSKTQNSVSSSSFNESSHEASWSNDAHQSKKKDTWSNGSGPLTDHHRYLKKKETYSLRCKLFSIVGTIITIGLIVGIILMALWIKPKRPSITRLPAILRWNTSGITIAGTGVAGNGSSQLQQPWDLALDWSNTLYVTDRFNHRVQKFLMGARNGTTVAGQANGIAGAGADFLREPTGIYVDQNGNVYVMDKNNHRLQYWAKDSLSGVTLLGNGSSGNGINQLSSPYGIDRDSNTGIFYIADFSNSRIVSYTYNATFGNVVAGGNGAGINNSQLSYPSGIFFDGLTNSLVITNVESNNVVRWKLGESYRTVIAGSTNGTSGTSSTYLDDPTDVTFDPMGNMYVVDRTNHRIQLFLTGQSNGITIAGVTSTTGSNSTHFSGPSSLILDNQLNLYVTDRGNHRVQKFLRY